MARLSILVLTGLIVHAFLSLGFVHLTRVSSGEAGARELETWVTFGLAEYFRGGKGAVLREFLPGLLGDVVVFVATGLPWIGLVFVLSFLASLSRRGRDRNY